MLAQPLTRRLHCHNVWTQAYQLHLRQAVLAREVPRWQHSRSVQTQAQARRAPPASSPASAARKSVTATRAAPKSAATSKNLPTTKTQSAKQSISLQPAPGQYVARDPAEIEVERQLRECQTLLGEHKEVQIYKAPSHGSLMILSLLGGLSFSAMAFNTAAAIMTLGGVSLFLQVPTVIGCVIGLGMGFNMLITTTRTIDSIRLIRSEDDTFKLKFDTKWRIYFWERKSFESSLQDVHTDRNVRDTEMIFYTIDLKERHAWTKWVDEHPPSFSVGRILKGMKEGMFNMWIMLKRNVARMFLRHGMMVVRIKNQKYKMDMWHAQLLDDGRVFSQLVKEDKAMSETILGIVRRQLSS